MKKFRFKLETVLKLRTMKLDEKIRALAEIVSLINSYKARILENEGEIELSRTKLNETIQAGVDLSGFRAFDAYIKRLYIENENYMLEIEKQNPVLNKAREEVFEARKHVRILEILKEKKLKEYNDLLSKIERNEIEEFNLISASRRKRNGDREAEFVSLIRPESEEPEDFEREFTKKESTELQKLYDRFA